MAKRVYRTWYGIPIWIIVGISLFFLLNAFYDWIVGDTSWGRYAIMIGSVIILIMCTILHIVPIETIAKMAKRQMGG